MSGKPEKIRLCLCGMLARNTAYKDTYYCSRCGVIHNRVTEYNRADLAKPSEWISVESKAKAFDFIQEHATRIHFDDVCDSLVYSDKEHFAKDDWLLRAVEKAITP